MNNIGKPGAGKTRPPTRFLSIGLKETAFEKMTLYAAEGQRESVLTPDTGSCKCQI